MHPTWCMALVAGEELFQFVAVFVLTVRVSDIRDRGKESAKYGHGHELKKGVMSRHWMVGEEMNGVEFSFIS